MEYKVKKVDLSENTNKQLDELSKTRRALGNVAWRKKDIVAELISNLHKKECKQ